VAFLKALVLNQECRVALKNNSMVKRDDFTCKNQDQAGIALFALGEAISEFLLTFLNVLFLNQPRKTL